MVFVDNPCADPESFVRGGPTMTTSFFVFVLVDEGREDQNTTISGPSSALQQNVCFARAIFAIF